MLNHITIMGRLTRDPEIRTVGSGIAVAQFTVAVDRDFQKEGSEKQTDFIDCRAWRQTAEFMEKYFSKGMMIVAEGSLQCRKWQDNEGNNRTSWFVNIEKVYFGEPKRERGEEKPYSTYARSPVRKPDISAADFEELPNDGELPF